MVAAVGELKRVASLAFGWDVARDLCHAFWTPLSSSEAESRRFPSVTEHKPGPVLGAHMP